VPRGPRVLSLATPTEYRLHYYRVPESAGQIPSGPRDTESSTVPLGGVDIVLLRPDEDDTSSESGVRSPSVTSIIRPRPEALKKDRRRRGPLNLTSPALLLLLPHRTRRNPHRTCSHILSAVTKTRQTPSVLSHTHSFSSRTLLLHPVCSWVCECGYSTGIREAE
jgi:hypothetical protein